MHGPKAFANLIRLIIKQECTFNSNNLMHPSMQLQVAKKSALDHVLESYIVLCRCAYRSEMILSSFAFS